MTDKPDAADGQVDAAQAAGAPGAPAMAPEADTGPAGGDPTMALTEEVAQLKDRLLRTLAEMENLRRQHGAGAAGARPGTARQG